MSSFGYSKQTLQGDLPEDPNNAPAQPQQQQAGFFVRTAIHIIGAIAGGLAMFLGLFSCFSLSGLCILSGLYLMLLGFGLIVLEAPICCQFWEITRKLGEWSNSMSALLKAGLYLLLPIASFFMCRGISQIFACLLVMGVGALYGIIFIGKKGDAVKIARQQHVMGTDGSQAVTMSEVKPQADVGRYP